MCTIWIRRIFWVESRYWFKSIRFPSTYLPICINKKSLNHYVQVMCYNRSNNNFFFFERECVLYPRNYFFFLTNGERSYSNYNVIESSSWLKNYNDHHLQRWLVTGVSSSYMRNMYHIIWQRKHKVHLLFRLLVLSILSRRMSVFLIHFTFLL